MAPGYHSPFDRPPSPKPIHNTEDGMLPILAIPLLCVSIVLCLALFTFRTASRLGHREYLQLEDDASAPVQEMALHQASAPTYIAPRPSEDPRRVINIRDLFLHDDSRVDDVQRPLPPAETYSGIKMATPRDNDAHKGSMNWHGTNTLNTSWGWMA